jgi:aryl-alcohol dehydrogenase-like predicted oxidoreductase
MIGQAMRKYDIPREKLVIMSKCFVAVGEQPALHMAPFDKSKDYVNQGGKLHQLKLTLKSDLSCTNVDDL